MIVGSGGPGVTTGSSQGTEHGVEPHRDDWRMPERSQGRTGGSWFGAFCSETKRRRRVVS